MIFQQKPNDNMMKARRTIGVCAAMMLLWLMATFAMAQEQQLLVVWLKNGQKITHNLTDQPETRFSDGQLMLSTSRVSVSYPLTDVLRYTYEGASTHISAMKVRHGEIRVQQGNEEMQIEGLPEGTDIETYSTEGILLQTQQSVGGQPTHISLKGQPKGVYLIKIGEATYKFLKR